MKKLLLLTFTALTINANAQWAQTAFSGDSAVVCFATSGTNIFAGTLGQGVYYSTNTGGTWTPANNGLNSLHIHSLAIQGTNVFAGTQGSGVEMSTIAGLTWTVANTGILHDTITALVVNNTTIFAGSWNGGVYMSTNSGGTWTIVNTGLTNLKITSLAVVSGGSTIFAGTPTGVFYSSNNGTSWVAVNTGLTPPSVTSLATIGTTVFAGTAGGVFKSTTNGSLWTIASGLPVAAVTALNVSGTKLFAGVGLAGVYETINTGTSWTAVSTGLNLPCNISSLGSDATKIYAGVTGTTSGVWSRALSQLSSIDEIAGFNNNYTVYPVPASEQIKLDFTLSENKTVVARIYNTLGEQVQTEQTKSGVQGNNEIQIQIAELPEGIYFAQILLDGNVAGTKRFIVSK
jgi:hypothetical protein